MCGCGTSNDGKVDIYLGWYGAEICVNDLTYSIQGEHKQPTTKEQMTEHIKNLYTYDDKPISSLKNFNLHNYHYHHVTNCYKIDRKTFYIKK